jgi:hypothetical protein
MRNKPKGGLWVSPLNSQISWKDWCLEEEFPCNIEYYFKLKFYKSAKIYKIDFNEDLLKLPHIYYKETDCYYPDFEEIMKSFDAIWLTEKGVGKTNSMLNSYNLYGWDCESVLIMNKNSFYTI